jgi:predicted phosphodiesterase
MYLYSKEIRYQGDPWIPIYPLGDIHEGTIHCDRKLFRRDVGKIDVDPLALWLGIGDYCESIVMSDPRFAVEEIDPEFIPHLGRLACAQRDAFIRDVMPIKDKCIGLLEGNHEFENRKRHYVDIVRDACRELETEYLSDAAMIRLIFRRVDEEGNHVRSNTIKIFACHGHGGGRKTGGKVNKVEDLMDSFDADIYLMGHVHTKLTVKRPRLLVPNCGKMKLIAKPRIGALTGSYYRTYEECSSSYGQRQVYAPLELGGVCIKIRPMTGEIETVV